MVPNGASTFLAKETVALISGLASLPNKAPGNLPDWIILDTALATFCIRPYIISRNISYFGVCSIVRTN